VSAPLIDPEMTKIYNNACGRHYFFLGILCCTIRFNDLFDSLICLSGRIYNEGQGVETNLSEALKWFSRASDFFEENATCNVGPFSLISASFSYPLFLFVVRMFLIFINQVKPIMTVEESRKTSLRRWSGSRRALALAASALTT